MNLDRPPQINQGEDGKQQVTGNAESGPVVFSFLQDFALDEELSPEDRQRTAHLEEPRSASCQIKLSIRSLRHVGP